MSAPTSIIITVLVWSTLPSAAELGAHCRYSGDCEGSYNSTSNWATYLFLIALGICYVYSAIIKPRATIVMSIGVIGTGIFYIAPMYILDGKTDNLITILISISGAIGFFKIWSIIADKIAPEINEKH